MQTASNKYLIVLGGPTASGKTATAIQLSQHFNAPILNCDSRQFYREMNIGTAKPTEAELAAAPHHFINNLSIHDSYNVGDYEQDALALLDQIYAKNDLAILTGGSGLFIKAVCEGLDVFPEITATVKAKVNDIYEKEGLIGLQNALKSLDHDYFSQVDQDNHRRLIRALEVCFASGQPYSHFLNQKKPARPFTPIYLCLDWDRTALYDRINLRVDLMMEAGLLAEAQSLFPHRELRSLQTVGYKELFQHFDSEEITLTDAIEKIKQNSRRYAKRQLTWFRNSAAEWFWFHPSETPVAIKHINEKVRLSF